MPTPRLPQERTPNKVLLLFRWWWWFSTEVRPYFLLERVLLGDSSEVAQRFLLWAGEQTAIPKVWEGFYVWQRPKRPPNALSVRLSQDTWDPKYLEQIYTWSPLRMKNSLDCRWLIVLLRLIPWRWVNHLHSCSHALACPSTIWFALPSWARLAVLPWHSVRKEISWIHHMVLDLWGRWPCHVGGVVCWKCPSFERGPCLAIMK